LLHTTGRLRSRPVDRQRIDDGGGPPQVTDNCVSEIKIQPSGGPAGRVGAIHPRRHRYQKAIRRPEKETVNSLRTYNQPVDIIPRRAHHVSTAHLTICILSYIIIIR